MATRPSFWVFALVLFVCLAGCNLSDPVSANDYEDRDTGDLDAGPTIPDTDLVPDVDTTPDTGPTPACLTNDDCAAAPGSEATCTDDGTCEYACNEGFVNVDGSSATGCECEFTEANDVPDGTDTNCDGVDGIAEQNVYVTTAGSDDAAGITSDAPFATLSRAIEFAAATESRTTILVGAGEYHENIVLESGVHLYGGYEADWSLGSARTVLIADATEADKNIATLTATGIDEDTILSRFEIHGPDNSAMAGASTYAVRVLESPDEKLQLVNVQIVAGKAGDGINGVDGAAAGTGEDGTAGVNETPGDGGTSACGARGGDGGAPLACPASRGETGANGEAGVDSELPPGAGGQGGINFCTWSQCLASLNENNHGISGAHGGSGSDGESGKTPQNPMGTFHEGVWIAGASEPAQNGETGTGGGGGGGGGSFRCLDDGSGTRSGGSGGGGGAGGCNGLAGTNGQAGGSAFALVLVNSAVNLVDVEFVLGAAGDGGAGGAGSAGVPGRAGGAGHPGVLTEYLNSGDGGAGGDGGDGGHGGGGAGGCGGSSIGIALVGTSALSQDVSYTRDDAAVAGNGGAGGSSPGNAGEEGCAGEILNTANY